MKKYRTLILDRKTVEKLIDIKKTISAVEYAFREHGLKRTQMPPKIYLHIKKYSGDFRAMPASIEKLNKCALKWVNVHPQNKKYGLPTVMAIIILSDPKNGFPLSIMDGTHITNLRTGAAGAVAAKYLARKNSKIIALVGCGIQAKTQLQALNEILNIKEVKIWSKDKKYVPIFLKDMKYLGLKLIPEKNIKECIRGSDIIVTTTPSRKPIIKSEWIKRGTHINAIGADAKGKEELDPHILKKAKIVVDSWEQASHSGEINVPVSKGLISKKNIYAEIGEIVSGKKRGRTNPKEITVFDSTGLGIQDLAVANLIYKNALKKKINKWIELI